MNKISMRRAQPSDVPALIDLLRQVNEVHFRGRPDLFRRATKYSADDVSATMSDDDRPIFGVISQNVCTEFLVFVFI